MTGANKARTIGRAACAAAWVALACLPAAWASGQHGGTSAAHSSPAPRAQAPRSQYVRPQGAAPRIPARPRANAYPRPSAGNPSNGARSAYPGPPYLGPGTPRPTYPGYPRPAYSGSGYPLSSYAPPGHLGDWLNQHRSLPVQQQQQMLRNDPSFNRLAPADQQRVMRQLSQVNQLSDEQRQRRLARAETLERMSPQERNRVADAARQWAAQPVARQALMKSAFRDLRSVPLDQRQTVLNSDRYKGVFSPQERDILSNMLRAEPYEPAR